MNLGRAPPHFSPVFAVARNGHDQTKQKQKEKSMKRDLEKRMTQVSRLISDNTVESMLDMRTNTPQTFSLCDALEILDPQLIEMDAALDRLIQKHDLNTDLFNDIRNRSATNSYVIGIIAGLYLGSRGYLVSQLTQMYLRTTEEEAPRDYDENGKCTPREN
jgi:hypothetical protein